MTGVLGDAAVRDGAASATSDRLRVDEVRDESDGVRSLRLTGLAGQRLADWEPGAHLEIVLPSGLVRHYSLCGDPEDHSGYRIAVLREPNSRGGSAELHDAIGQGAELTVRAPRNHFALRPASSYLFIAGGVGITPILPMIVAAQRRSIPWRLVYGGRSRASMAFRERLAALGPDHVEIVPEDERGLPDLAGAIAAAPNGLIYACGPEGLLRAVESETDAQGRRADLNIERFSAATDSSPAATVAAFEVELRRTGQVLAVAEDTSILEVVRQVLPGVASSCEEGFCGTCETRVLGGTPDHRDSLLSQEERAACDTMMICVSRAAGGRLILDL
ncbi:PDR/VanB family oxidoreductase [Nocardia alni]|uniref:PDR/VanB family oxidoreductase n=1 Tax=Nocardia alni TaxID=2815723 RepID=UPI001C217B7B|nr:PDR/VanB family oxidoreductase [Nocardia alni]